MKILIGTPTYDEHVTNQYHESVVALLRYFRERNAALQFDHRLISLATIHTTRNIFATMVFDDASYTHLLFIDSDMGFRPTLIDQLIRRDKPVIGAICPKRRMDLPAFHAACRAFDDPYIAAMVSQEYVGDEEGNLIAEKIVEENGVVSKTISIEDGCIRVNRLGAGIMLIRRDVLVALRDRYPELWFEKPHPLYQRFGLNAVLQCFEPIARADGAWMSEDMSFCHRWVEGCKGEIWASITETIAHVGPVIFGGQYLTKLKYGKHKAA